ncbi:MAG: Hpt domain-containing protein [Candidatus Marinimicrobia bacterium]|nr:Hpt domain-containing protein [Candidatus Neomarinimicrobiota bacterium]
MIELDNSGDIDPLFLSRLVELGGTKLAMELIDMYLVRGADLLDAISTGIAANDFAKIRSAAHSLISSAGNLGGKKVSELAKLLEKSAMEENPAPLKSLLSEALSAQITFQEYLRGVMGKL